MNPPGDPNGTAPTADAPTSLDGAPESDDASIAELEAFMAGESRLVFARLIADPKATPYFLVDGTGRDPGLKEWAAASLECLMPECTDRRMRVINRSEHSGRRDGFAHHAGAGGHTAESLFHMQGKIRIQEWVRATQPDALVDLEARAADGERIADILITWPTGRKIAVEIQCSAIGYDQWKQRQESYRGHSITPVWLFGHTSPHTQALWDREAAGAVEVVRARVGLFNFSFLHRKIVESGAPVLWFNPVDGTIATPWVVKSAYDGDHEHAVPPNAETAEVRLCLDPLSACELDPEYGIITPASTDLATGLRALNDDIERHLEEAKAEAAARAAREAEARDRRAEAYRKRLAEQQETDGADTIAPVPPEASRPGEVRTEYLQWLDGRRFTSWPPTDPGFTWPFGPGPWTHCVKCDLKLDEMLRPYGFHFGCQPYPIN